MARRLAQKEAISKSSALDGEVAELHADLGLYMRAVLETSGDVFSSGEGHKSARLS